MPRRPDVVLDWYAGPCYLAGQRVPAGRYEDIETHRDVVLSEDGVLPATLDGRVAAYVPKGARWADIIESDDDALAVW